jgi:2-dehydropantoate 2-reductase
MDVRTGYRPRSVAVLGAGAVGAYFGAMLARAGVAVTLVGRAAHVDAIRRDGLVVIQGSSEWSVAVDASTAPEAVGGAELVIVSVKSHDTDAAVAQIAPRLRRDARLVSFQNGVDNAARIAGAVDRPTYAAVVYVGTQMAGPGRVLHTGRGDLVIGRPQRVPARGDEAADLAAIAGLLEGAGVPCRVSEAIDVALWTKLALNCAFNAISAVSHARYAEMVAIPAIRTLMDTLVREVVRVATADGVRLDADELVAAAWTLAAAMPDQYSSTAQDLERGKGTEIDALNGFVARRGTTLGVAAPANQALHALVKLRESRAAR